MAYVRKTKDEYRIETFWFDGSREWDVECTEDTYMEARQRLKEYRENADGRYMTRLRIKRVRIQAAEVK